jgi:hypothetical protein
VLKEGQFEWGAHMQQLIERNSIYRNNGGIHQQYFCSNSVLLLWNWKDMRLSKWNYKL